MADVDAFRAPRWVGFLMAVIGLVAIVIAVIHTPLGDWTGAGYFIAGLLLLLSIAWLVVALRGPVNVIGKMKGRTAMIVSAFGALLAGVLLGVNIFSDEWSVSTIIFTGLWAQLAVMFVAALGASNRKMKAGQ